MKLALIQGLPLTSEAEPVVVERCLGFLLSSQTWFSMPVVKITNAWSKICTVDVVAIDLILKLWTIITNKVATNLRSCNVLVSYVQCFVEWSICILHIIRCSLYHLFHTKLNSSKQCEIYFIYIYIYIYIHIYYIYNINIYIIIIIIIYFAH